MYQAEKRTGCTFEGSAGFEPRNEAGTVGGFSQTLILLTKRLLLPLIIFGPVFSRKITRM